MAGHRGGGGVVEGHGGCTVDMSDDFVEKYEKEHRLLVLSGF